MQKSTSSRGAIRKRQDHPFALYAATVVDATYMGIHVDHTLGLGDNSQLVARVQSSSGGSPNVGDSVNISIDAKAVQVLKS